MALCAIILLKNGCTACGSAANTNTYFKENYHAR